MQPTNRPKFDIARKVTGWAADLEMDVRRFFTDLQYKITHLPETNYLLGVRFAGEGKLRDAILRFRVSLYFAPQYAPSWYYLGRCYLATGEREKASAALIKSLTIDAAQPDAKYLLATIDERILRLEDRPQKMPAHMMEDFFASVATHYNEMERAAGYGLPEPCYRWVRPKLSNAAYSVLDMGCGTGLSAMPWRKEAKEIIGVDSVSAMAERARYARVEGEQVFDAVLTQDAATLAKQVPHSQSEGGFDVVLLINVLAYAGEPTALIRSAAAHIKESGMVLITIEPYLGDAGFGVVAATSRFGHKADYLTKIASDAGLTRIDQTQISMYVDNKVLALLFAKNAVAA